MNIVIINNLPHFDDPARWDFDLVSYQDAISHTDHHVSYIVNRRGRSGVTAAPGSYALYQLDQLGDAAAYRAPFEHIVAAHGAIDRIVAFSESLQDVSAQLREQYDVPGNRGEQNRAGRDKLLMKQKVLAAGLRAPRYLDVRNGAAGLEAALASAGETGFPLILKPIDGQSSQGVQKLADRAQLEAAVLALPEGQAHDLEEFIDGTLFHVDGLLDREGRVLFMAPSRYLNPCLDFTLGAPLGAVMVAPDTALHAALNDFSTRCLTALGLRACPFHLELFQTPSGELVFLEVGARVGGADVPSMIHRNTGVNLFAEWLKLIMGRAPQLPPQANNSVGGWLMFPRPPGLPLRVTAVTSLLGQLPSLYLELLPAVGQVIEHEEGYASLQAGRFLFSAASAEQVERDMRQAMATFSIATTAPDAAVPAGKPRKALLLFAHQGRAYLAAVQKALRELDVACLVLSSRPRDTRDLDQLRALAPQRLWHVEDSYLDQGHVRTVLEQAAAEGYEVLAALATFEGYRHLMALTNAELGATDAGPAEIAHCMDKYLCRKDLFEQGLSRSNAVLLDATSLPLLQADGQRHFVKPRRGAGSFACFRLEPDLNMAKLAALQGQMRDDLAFRAIFAGQFDFIAEDYVGGDEYSFEVLVAEGQSYVIGVHAKYLDEAGGTTLETSNSCPAPRLSDAHQLAGEHYVARCLHALELEAGCYHIEMRHQPADGHWDIIEINARMGGALINQSIGVFTGGPSILELWIQTLCCRSAAEVAELHARLAALRESTRRAGRQITHGSVFFSRYGERNQMLEHISIAELPRQPDICDIPVRAGTRLPDSERGIFILNALWKVDVADIAQELVDLSTMIDESFVVRYSKEASLN